MNTLRNCALVCCLLLLPQLAAPQQDVWVATWTAGPEPADPDPKDPVLSLEDQTVRERVRLSIGGAQVRIRLSNEYGSSPFLWAQSLWLCRTIQRASEQVRSGPLRLGDAIRSQSQRGRRPSVIQWLFRWLTEQRSASAFTFRNVLLLRRGISYPSSVRWFRHAAIILMKRRYKVEQNL